MSLSHNPKWCQTTFCSQTLTSDHEPVNYPSIHLLIWNMLSYVCRWSSHGEQEDVKPNQNPPRTSRFSKVIGACTCGSCSDVTSCFHLSTEPPVFPCAVTADVISDALCRLFRQAQKLKSNSSVDGVLCVVSLGSSGRSFYVSLWWRAQMVHGSKTRSNTPHWEWTGLRLWTLFKYDIHSVHRLQDAVL